MSCRRIRSELLDLLRFGDPGSRADAYLGHVERCGDCQHEVAVDRVLARELRQALRERVDGFEPSPAVWRGIRLRAADPEPAPSGWVASLIAAGRTVRVMVPVAAVVLAAVVSWSQFDTPVDSQDLGVAARASRSHWQESLSPAVTLDHPMRAADHIAPSPSEVLPRASGDVRYPDVLSSVKIFTATVPSVGGLIR
jgi:anti-sigma factor RsiW